MYGNVQIRWVLDDTRIMLSVQKKSKLTWRCRRGMLELDLMLNQFLNKALDTLSENDYVLLENFLTHPDPDLYAWLMDYQTPPETETVYCVKLIQSTHRSA